MVVVVPQIPGMTLSIMAVTVIISLPLEERQFESQCTGLSFWNRWVNGAHSNKLSIHLPVTCHFDLLLFNPLPVLQFEGYIWVSLVPPIKKGFNEYIVLYQAFSSKYMHNPPPYTFSDTASWRISLVY